MSGKIVCNFNCQIAQLIIPSLSRVSVVKQVDCDRLCQVVDLLFFFLDVILDSFDAFGSGGGGSDIAVTGVAFGGRKV
jgi:hypothetical protein